jgi:L-amino acid N-acyltransferase YncA
MKLISCTVERHAQAILDIFNHAIETSTALYDYHPRPLSAMASWFETKRLNDFPVIGIESDDGQLMGFASYGTFRAWPAYKYTVEHAVYVHPAHTGKGLGKRLMQALIEAAQARHVHMMVGVIDSANAASIHLHRALGFDEAGTLKHAGFKFGRWLDVVMYQLILPTPEHPVDG